MTERTCAYCGAPFKTPQTGALFCSRAHKTAYANMEAARGKQLYRLVYHWAMAGKGPEAGKAMGDLAWLARKYVAEDREDGRAPPPYGPSDMAPHHSYMTKRASKLARKRREAELIRGGEHVKRFAEA